MAVYGSPLLEDVAIVHVMMISEQLFMISAGNFCNKWKYFCPLLGAGRAVVGSIVAATAAAAAAVAKKDVFVCKNVFVLRWLLTRVQ